MTLMNTTIKPLNQNKMTPKEKAEELYNKYWDKLWGIQNRIENLHEQAKECALIAVDEILNDDWYIQSFDEMTERKKYWEQVKNEINNL